MILTSTEPREPLDIDFKYPLELNEGTWVNFIKWQKSGKFTWIYPNHKFCVDKEQGYCHADYNPFENKKYHSWSNITKKEKLKQLSLDNVEKIGIATSVTWLGSQQLNADFLPKLLKVKSKSAALKKMRDFSHEIDLSFIKGF